VPDRYLQVGLWGYLTGFEELLAQDSSITDVVISCGSGGSAAGMALANHLLGDPVKVHAISVCDDKVRR
jgi:1-aminocyclopropane-1-carboxylate deaminase/D-cysteine desulfhydrase-like pyridoxal-dependent ACC family enzyme